MARPMSPETSTANSTTTRSYLPWLRFLWDRDLKTYPSEAKRLWMLGLILGTSIVVYVEQYAGGSVAPLLLPRFGMSFSYYVHLNLVALMGGALFALFAGAGDRFGRANIFAYGVLIVGLLVLLGIPNAPSKFWFSVVIVAIGMVEGITLVVTTALVRDFSPQTQRASAASIWSLGVTVGALIAYEMGQATLPHLHTWQSQYLIAGSVGTGVGVIAVIFLRELSAPLRSQRMVSMRDRQLVALRAKGMDPAKAMAHPWRQMLRARLIVPSVGLSLWLIAYLTISSYFTLYLTTLYNFTTIQADGLLVWLYVANTIAYFVVGPLSDIFRVRKPFMLVGTISIIGSLLMILSLTHSHPSYYEMAWVLVWFAVSLSLVFGPWVAAYTETVEDINPALVATGLGIFGWVLRALNALTLLVFPYFVLSLNTIITNAPYASYAPTVIADQHKYAAQLAIVNAHPAIFAELAKYPAGHVPAAVLNHAIQVVGAANLASVAKAQSALHLMATVGPHLQDLGNAVKAAPGQWQVWWWISIAAAALILPTLGFLSGRWRPSSAKADIAAHHAQLERAIAEMTEGDLSDQDLAVMAEQDADLADPPLA
jgi:predicted MFS family arabinose efflux permease